MEDYSPRWKKVMWKILSIPVLTVAVLFIVVAAILYMPCAYFCAFVDALCHWKNGEDTFEYCWRQARFRRELA